MLTEHTPARPRRRILAPAAAGAALTTTLAAVVAAALTIPISAPLAASANLTLAVVTSPTVTDGAPVIGALTTSTADAEAALENARRAQDSAVAVMAEVAESGLAERIPSPSIDTAELRAATAELAGSDLVPVLLFPDLAEDAAAQTAAIDARVAEVRSGLDAARAQKAEEDAAAQAQRDAEAAARAAAEALVAANTPEGAKATARQMAADRYGWGGDQFSCLASLWQKESSWNYRAVNASSGATGIPQALPGSKMASAGSDWQTNASTQIAWGLQYIDAVYGSPCGAWAKSQASNWY